MDHYKGSECQLSDAFMFRDVDCQNGSVSLNPNPCTACALGDRTTVDCHIHQKKEKNAI